MLSLPLRPPPSSPRGGEEGGWGEGEGRRSYSAAPTLQPLQPCFSASRRRMRCPQCSSDHYGAVMVKTHQQPRFLIML